MSHDNSVSHGCGVSESTQTIEGGVLINITKVLKKPGQWVLVFIWICIIISYSNDPAIVSNSKSYKIVDATRPIVDKITLFFHLKTLSRNDLNFIIRKNAHIINYFIVTALCYIALGSRLINENKRFIVSWSFATSLAICDEFYQTLIPGRSGRIFDVFIDNIGINIAIMIIVVILKLNKTRID